MRSRNVLRCCWASTVVGTNTATWRPPWTALKAVRIATSVLPKPTSPQMRRSMGRVFSMSALLSMIAFIWSGVSVKGNDASELGFRLTQTDIAADQVRLLQRNVQRHMIVKLEGDHFTHALRCIEFR